MGVYVKCYCFSIFVVVGSVYYKYQYRITYTLCGGLNRLQVYVTEIKEKQIFERIQVAKMRSCHLILSNICFSFISVTYT